MFDLIYLIRSIGAVKIYATNSDIYPYYACYSIGMDPEDGQFKTFEEACKWATLH